MGIFSFLHKPKEYFSAQEKEQIVNAISNAEKETSGEIRIYVESHNSMVDVMDRASEIFSTLQMQNTVHHNAVLLYIAMKDKELALFGDEGIYKVVGEAYWNNAVKMMIAHFSNQNITSGIVQCIGEIGNTLKDKFPFDAAVDKNELSNDIVFGK